MALVDPDEQRERRQGHREEAQHAAAPPFEPAFVTRPLGQAAPAPAPVASTVAASCEGAQPAAHEGEVTAAAAAAAAVAPQAGIEAAPAAIVAHDEAGAWFGDPPAAVALAKEQVQEDDDMFMVAETQVLVASVKVARKQKESVPLATVAVGRTGDTLYAGALRRVVNDPTQRDPGWLCEGGVSYATLVLQVNLCLERTRACVCAASGFKVLSLQYDPDMLCRLQPTRTARAVLCLQTRNRRHTSVPMMR